MQRYSARDYSLVEAERNKLLNDEQKVVEEMMRNGQNYE